MTRGWKSPGRVLSVRVDLSLYDALVVAAASRNLSLGDYVRRVLVDIIEHPTVDSTPSKLAVGAKQPNPTVDSTAPKLAPVEKQANRTVDSTPTEPQAYRRGVSYVAGTRVLVPTRRGDLVEMVAPELDADGRPIPEDS